MVYSSPLKRSALGSISSILNTTSKTPAKQGRIGKSATPQKSGIRQKLANMFTSNKKNSPRKPVIAEWTQGNREKERKRTDSVYDLLAMDIDTVPSGKVDGVRELGIASVVDVSVSTNMTDPSARSAPPKFSPEIAALLTMRLQLATYKVTTQQIHTPFTKVAALPVASTDSVSHAIQRFRESKEIQDQADYYRQRRLSTICRREARRTRHEKSTLSPQQPEPTTVSTVAPIPIPRPSNLTRKPSTITEIPSDQEDPGLPSPPDSQLSKQSLVEVPTTPAPKPKKRRVRKTKTYDEFNGHLGLSSPPQQAYDPQETSVRGEWYMDDVEVGDVPSSVLRGVEGLWALGC